MQRPWLLLLASTLLFSSRHSSYTSTHAQTPPPIAYAPTPLYLAHSVFIPRQKLFIHGGTTGDKAAPIAQTFYIDLSKKWPASKPIYGKLADGTAAMGTTTALSNSNSAWYSFYQQSAFRFNIQSGTWETLSKSMELSTKDDLPAVTDPATNQIYILDGYAMNTIVQGMRFDTASGQFSKENQIIPLLGGFTMTWSSLKKVAFIYGGYIHNSQGGAVVLQKTMYFYNPSNSLEGGPSVAPDSGDIPSARVYHCMVEAYNGTKMILFGGFDQSGRALDDIYILDVSSLKWTKGTPGGPTVARGCASCAVTNDYFVVWGGAVPALASSTVTVVSQNVTLVYNLVTNQWVDEYFPDPYVLPPPAVTAVTPPSGTGTGSGFNPTGTDTSAGSGATTDGNSSLVWIIGGVVGGLAVVGVVVGLFILRRRRKSSRGITTTVGKDNIYDDSDKRAPDHIFQPSTSDSGAIEKPVPIDHYQQNHMLVKQRELLQPQYQQEQKEQERLSRRSPHMLIIDSPPVITSTTSGPGANGWPIYQSATQSPHTTNDTLVFAPFLSPVRRPHTPNDAQGFVSSSSERPPHAASDTQVFAFFPSPKRRPHTTTDKHFTQVFASIPSPEQHPHTFPH